MPALNSRNYQTVLFARVGKNKCGAELRIGAVYPAAYPKRLALYEDKLRRLGGIVSPLPNLRVKPVSRAQRGDAKRLA